MKLRQLAVMLVGTGLVFGASDAPARLDASADVLTEIMSSPDKGIPQDLLDKSACVIIVPGLKKGAFIIGGKYGKGFISCRKESVPGWSAPAAVRVEGGSLGLQIGGSETDVIMLLMNRGGATKLLSSKFTLGADAQAAAGPVGRESSADTDAKLHAEILTYSRSRGLFVGISLQGATLRPDDDWNHALYGSGVPNEDIVLGTMNAPPAASKLLAALNKFSARQSC
jgi:lipid-binding SYLF domain-containing protein